METNIYLLVEGNRSPTQETSKSIINELKKAGIIQEHKEVRLYSGLILNDPANLLMKLNESSSIVIYSTDDKDFCYLDEEQMKTFIKNLEKATPDDTTWSCLLNSIKD